VLGISEDLLKQAPLGDPKVSAGPIHAAKGLAIRLTRNLDKDRGFVNGAIGAVVDVLTPTVFTLRLSTGNMVLVHPISDTSGQQFLPCAYGYATTIRRAQGATLKCGCLFFDHCYPPERGYGYVGASRFQSREHLYHWGRLRRTDWLPVGGAGDQVSRSIDSASSDSEDEQAAEQDDNYVSEDDLDDEFEAAMEDAACMEEDSDEEPESPIGPLDFSESDHDTAIFMR
jgi:hypothetical protein